MTREMLRRSFDSITSGLGREAEPIHYCHPIEAPFWQRFYDTKPCDFNRWIQLKNECTRKWQMNHRVPKWTIAYLNEQYARKLATI